MRRLDEAAAAALGGEYEDLRAAGWTCCYLIGACERVRDFGRAAQWCREVEAFSRRLDIRFVTGVCRTHYGAVLCWRGEWEEAERVLRLRARGADGRAARVARGRRRAPAELRRRQGRLDEALALFGEAERHPLAQLGRAELASPAARPDLARARPGAAAAPHPAREPGRPRRPVEALVRAEAAPATTRRGRHARELRAIADAVGTTPLLGAASFAAGVVAGRERRPRRARDRFDDAAELFAAAGAPLERAGPGSGSRTALRALGADRGGRARGRGGARGLRGARRGRRAGARGASTAARAPGP